MGVDGSAKIAKQLEGNEQEILHQAGLSCTRKKKCFPD
jgi:hypothetical protein